MSVRVELGRDSYDIIIERGALKRAGEFLKLDRKVLIVTDSGVPEEYSRTVAECCRDAVTVTFVQGEGAKCFSNLETLCSSMLSHGMTRGDCVVAVGGGVVGDLAGFAAAIYMRGIDFYNIPTTVLSQVDSSVGGKTAVDLDGIKNSVGAFHQPRRVIIDPDVLATLPARQLSNGLAEALKMAATFDAELFSLFENGDVAENIERIIHRSVELKARVVEQDEKEQGLRRVLNFGHTVGHAIESREGLGGLYHGECVGLGMLPMCSESVRDRILPVLKKMNLPSSLDYRAEELWQSMCHDKKKTANGFSVVFVEEIGSFNIRRLSDTELYSMLEEALTK